MSSSWDGLFERGAAFDVDPETIRAVRERIVVDEREPTGGNAKRSGADDPQNGGR